MKNITNISAAVCGRCLALLLTAAAGVSNPLHAQPKLSTQANLDLVNQYIWRGYYLAGASLQPSFTTSYGGAELLVWGSTDLTTPRQELDATLSYTLAGFTLGLTDYWNGTVNEPYKERHLLEGNLRYSFDKIPLSLGWNTLFYGEVGKKTYSSYVELGYRLKRETLTVDFAAGLSPWKSQMLNTKRFALNCLSVKAAKLCMSGSYVDVSLYTALTYNHHTDRMFWSAGLSISQPK